jgi:hypothetical protein
VQKRELNVIFQNWNLVKRAYRSCEFIWKLGLIFTDHAKWLEILPRSILRHEPQGNLQDQLFGLVLRSTKVCLQVLWQHRQTGLDKEGMDSIYVQLLTIWIWVLASQGSIWIIIIKNFVSVNNAMED